MLESAHARECSCSAVLMLKAHMLRGQASNLREEAKRVTEGLDSCCMRRGFLYEAKRVRRSE
jgi:hypothetical protein